MSSFASRLSWAEAMVRPDPAELHHRGAVAVALEGIVATAADLVTDEEWPAFLALLRQDRRCHGFYAPNLCRTWWDALTSGGGRLPPETGRGALEPILGVLLHVPDGPAVAPCAACGLPRPVVPRLPWHPLFLPPEPCACWSCELSRNPPVVSLPAALASCPACGCEETDGRQGAPWRSLPGVVPQRTW
jgi:hypothetical protein